MPLQAIDGQRSANEYKHALILVHGLNGSGDSWDKESNRYVPNLRKTPAIFDNFKIFLFTYETRILNYFDFWRRLMAMIPGTNKKQYFNSGLHRISEELDSVIRNYPHSFNSFSFIAHSMGGIIVKRSLVSLVDQNPRLPLFFSLNVPHQGSLLANIGLKVVLGKNKQLRDLKLMGEYTRNLNIDFANPNIRTKVIYVHGRADDVVNAASAIPPGVTPNLRIVSDHTHYTILKIREEMFEPVFERIKAELGDLIVPKVNFRINIGKNQTFESMALTLGEVEQTQVNLVGFSDSELAAKIHETFIEGEDAIEVLKKLRLSSYPKVPEYSVKKENGVIELVKKKG